MTDNKGWTVAYISWDDCKPRVAGRFKTTEEKDAFLNEITKPNSGWTDEEIASIHCEPDYSYMLPY